MRDTTSGAGVCQSPNDAKCHLDSDCPPTLICGVDGECRNSCAADGECIASQVCRSSSCADPRELHAGELPRIDDTGLGARPMNDGGAFEGGGGSTLEATTPETSETSPPDASIDPPLSDGARPPEAMTDSCSAAECACGSAGQACCQASPTCTAGLACAGKTCSCVSSCDVYGAGEFAVAVRSTDGSVWVYEHYEPGATLPKAGPTPLRVDDTHILTGVTQVAASGGLFCALSSDTTVWCAGVGVSPNLNYRGERGIGIGALGDLAFSKRALQVLTSLGGGPLTGVRQVANGEGAVCALLESGRVMCWGAGDGGQVGNGKTTDSLSPALVRTSADAVLEGVDHLAGGRVVMCAHTKGARADGSGGAVYCWGTGETDQLAAGDKRVVPWASKIDRFPDTAIEIAANLRNTCVRLVNGRIMCLGTYWTTDGATPEAKEVMTATGVLTDTTHVVHRDYYGHCAVRKDASLWCWENSALAMPFLGPTQQPESAIYRLDQGLCYQRADATLSLAGTAPVETIRCSP